MLSRKLNTRKLPLELFSEVFSEAELDGTYAERVRTRSPLLPGQRYSFPSTVLRNSRADDSFDSVQGATLKNFFFELAEELCSSFLDHVWLHVRAIPMCSNGFKSGAGVSWVVDFRAPGACGPVQNFASIFAAVLTAILRSVERVSECVRTGW